MSQSFPFVAPDSSEPLRVSQRSLDDLSSRHDVGLDYLGLDVVRVSRSDSEARRMVEFYHYLQKWPGVVTLILLMRCAALDKGVPYARPVGVCVFSIPPRETEKRYGGKTWELARLWIENDMPKNSETWLMARAIRFIQRECIDVQFLVSYADPSRGHRGTIYRAGNWTSDGRTDQERKTARFDYRVGGKTFGRSSHVPQGALVERVPRISKYRFVYPLTRTARRLMEARTEQT